MFQLLIKKKSFYFFLAYPLELAKSQIKVYIS